MKPTSRSPRSASSTVSGLTWGKHRLVLREELFLADGRVEKVPAEGRQRQREDALQLLRGSRGSNCRIAMPDSRSRSSAAAVRGSSTARSAFSADV
jgi:hypothetical protein